MRTLRDKGRIRQGDAEKRRREVGGEMEEDGDREGSVKLIACQSLAIIFKRPALRSSRISNHPSP